MATTSSDTAASDGFRQQLHQMWATVAPAWGEHAAYADARGAAVTERLLEAAAPAAGERLLELACGPGSVGLAAAALVGPEGEVVLSDVVPEMTSIAAERAAALGLTNVRTAVLDFEQIDEPDASYDVVASREGLMFATDPARAFGEIHRILRPGGRVALAVWGPQERNPWLGLVLETVSTQLGRPIPPPGVPGPFALGDAERLAALCTTAGFADVVVDEVAVPLKAATFDEWWSRTSSLAGPLSLILASMPDEAQAELRTRLLEAVAPYETDDGFDFPGMSLVVSACRP